MDSYPSLLRRSTSSGGPIRSLHGSAHSLAASQLNSSGLLINDSFATMKGASALRTSLGAPDAASVLSTSASFHGSGISDLRATVVAQQRQLDGLIDKVATLLGAMHTEVLNDVRNVSTDVGGRLDEVRRAGADLDNRLAELRMLQNVEGGLQAWLGREVGKLQEDFASRVQESQERQVCELQGMGSKIHSLLERVETAEEAALRAAQEEPSWQLAIQQSCESLREELSRDMMRGACEPLWTRVRQIEEQLFHVHDDMLQAARPNPSLEEERGQQRERLERVEVCTRLHGAALERLEADVRNLRLAGSATKDLEVQSLEWQQRAEQRLQTSAAGEARLGILEQWRKRVEERLSERPTVQLGTLRERLTGFEQRLNSLSERVDSTTTALSSSGPSAAPRQVPDACFDELRIRLDSMAASAGEDSRHVTARLRELDVFAARLEGVEATTEAARREIAELRGERRTAATLAQLQLSSQPNMQGILDSRVMGLEAALECRVEELRHDLEGEISRRIVGDLRQELETQVYEGAKTQAPQGYAVEFREELEARVAKAYNALQRHLTELKQDIETRVGEAQKSTGELRKEFESEAGKSRGSFDRLGDELRQGLQGARSFAEETQRQVSAMRIQQQQVPGVPVNLAVSPATLSPPTVSTATGAAQEAAQHAVVQLGQRLEEQMGELLGERLARCDAAAAGCERCAKAVEDRLQALAEDLRGQLARESRQLLEVLGDERGLAIDGDDQGSRIGPALALQDHSAAAKQETSTLRDVVEGYLLERKVTRSLAGLEEHSCSGSPKTFVT